MLKTDGGTSIIAATEKGYAIRFDENDVRCVGRQARGVRAVRLTAATAWSAPPSSRRTGRSGC